MVLGMGSVFIFLTLLVVAMQLTSRVVRAIDERHALPNPSDGETTGAAQANSDMVTAITAAIHRYRQTHKH